MTLLIMSFTKILLFLQGGTYHFSWFMSAPKYSTYRVNINKYSVNFVVNKLTEDIRTVFIHFHFDSSNVI